MENLYINQVNFLHECLNVFMLNRQNKDSSFSGIAHILHAPLNRYDDDDTDKRKILSKWLKKYDSREPTCLFIGHVRYQTALKKRRHKIIQGELLKYQSGMGQIFT